MKGLKFEKLDSLEEEFCYDISVRCGKTLLKKKLNTLRIAKIVQRPWMCVFLKNGKTQGIGFSKQCQYAPDKDDWNEDIGKSIALSRAVRDMLGE